MHSSSSPLIINDIFFQVEKARGQQCILINELLGGGLDVIIALHNELLLPVTIEIMRILFYCRIVSKSFTHGTYFFFPFCFSISNVSYCFFNSLLTTPLWFSMACGTVFFTKTSISFSCALTLLNCGGMRSSLISRKVFWTSAKKLSSNSWK